MIKKANNNDNTDLEKIVLQHLTHDKMIQRVSLARTRIQ